MGRQKTFREMVFDQLVERVLSVHRSASNFVLVPFFAAHLWFGIATMMADRPEDPRATDTSVRNISIIRSPDKL